MSQSRLAWFKQMDWVSWTTAVLIVVLPLPRHWVLIAQPYAGINAVLTDFGLSVGELVALVLVAGTAVSNVFNAKAQSQKGAKRKRKSIVLTLLGGLTLLTLLSSVWALDSVLAFQQGMRLLLLFGLVVAVGQRGVNETAVQTGIALSLAVQAGTALVQFITQDDLGLRLLGELDLNRYPGGGSILTVGETYWLRSYGLTPHSNIAGGVLAALLLLGTAVYLQ
ncbi:MAG: hypothetical protein KC419_02345, partial [Anaerolineales bacterium]|nr:hypothetical protein [Anaerolineales bacterium]